MIVAKLDRELAFYVAGLIFGISLTVIAFLGEFVFHWWNDFGVWLGGAGIAATIAFSMLTATKFQVRHLDDGIQTLKADTTMIKADTSAIKADTTAIKATAERIEGNTERIESNTHETVQLLREIRDRLPGPGT